MGEILKQFKKSTKYKLYKIITIFDISNSY